jgi:DNA-binding NtrC family response regulator
MARILLFDPDENHAKTVVSALESTGHKLTLCRGREEAFNQFSARLAEFNVIILDFSNRPEDWDLLNKLHGLTVKCVPKPGILCLARSNWGSGVKLQVERKGARLLYERLA